MASGPKPSSLGKATSITLLAASSLTVMSGATIAPSLPAMRGAFDTVEDVDVLVRLVLTVPALFIAVLGVMLGNLVDRIDRRRMLVFGALLFAGAGTSGLWLDHLVPILIGRAVLGISVAIVMTASTALIADYLEGPSRLRFLGLQAAFMAFGGVVFLVGGGLLADVSWRGPFWIYGLALPIAIGGLFLPEPNVDEKTSSTHRGDLAWVPVLGLGLAAFGAMLFFYTVPTQLPFDLQSRLGLGGGEAGLAIAMCNLMAGLASLRFAAFARRFSSLGLLGIAFGGLGVGLIGVFVAPSYATVLVAMGVAGVGMGLFMPNLNQWAVRLVAPERRGTAVAVIVASLFAGQFVSPLIGQPLVDAYDVRTVFAIMGTACALLGVLLVVLARVDRRMAAAAA